MALKKTRHALSTFIVIIMAVLLTLSSPATGYCGHYPTTIHHKQQADITLAVVKQVHQQKLSHAQGISELCNTLTDYSQAAGLESSLLYFVEKTTARLAKDLYIEEPEEKGFSKDPVFIVRDRGTSDKILILKLFADHSPNLIPEIYSLQFLTESRIPDFFSPEIHALGRCRQGEISYFILAETVAKGNSILYFCKQQAKFDIGSPERNRSLLILSKGMHLLGRSLAQLHTHKKCEFKKLPEEFLKRVEGYLTTTLEKLKANPIEGIDSKMLQTSYADAQKSFESRKRSTTVIHGDVKFENVFFDPDCVRITLIDPAKLADSLDSFDQPIGCPAKDIGSLLACFKDWKADYFLNEQLVVSSKELLTNNEITQLIDAFIKGYKEVEPGFCSQTDLDFFSLAGKLYFFALDRTKDPNVQIKEPLLTQMRKKIETITEDLKSTLALNKGPIQIQPQKSVDD